MLGQHTNEVLKEAAGYSPEHITQLLSTPAIFQA